MKKTGIIKAMKLCRDYEKMSPAARESLRQERLNALVAHAREHSPYYQKLYRNVGADFTLTDLPPTDKRTLMTNWNDWVCDRELKLEDVEAFMKDTDNIGRLFRKQYIVFTTSGSTGSPLVAVCDKTANSIMGGISA